MNLVRNIYANKSKYRSHLQYWDEKFSEVEQTCLLKNNLLAPSNKEYRKHKFNINQGLVILLNQYAKNDLALFVMVSSALSYLIKVYTGQSNVRLDTPSLMESGDLEGASSIVPLIISVDESISLRSFISKIKEVIVESYNYQSISIPDLYDAEGNQTNVFLKHKNIHFEHAASGYEFCFEFENSQDLEVTINYTSTTDFAAIKNLECSFLNIISHFDNLDIPLKKITLLSERQREGITERFSRQGVQGDIKSDQSFLSLFNTQVDKFANSVIVVQQDEAITYNKLNQLSNQLAHFLKEKHKIKKGSRIGIICEKSVHSIIGMLSVLKSGAIYIPINPTNPKERIEYIIKDAQISLLLIQSLHLPLLSDFYHIGMIGLDFQLQKLNTPTTNPDISVNVEDLAYVIYTSGTTGQPKGVICDYDGILRAAEYYISVFGITENDRYLQFLSLAFDGSILDIFTCLLSGSQLVLPNAISMENSSDFLDYINRHQVSITVLVPSFLRNLKKEDLNVISCFKTIVLAGETLDPKDICSLTGDTSIYNAYGPTEASVVTTVYHIEGNAKSIIPIGKPVSGREVYILDKYFRICPVGVTGQICISGKGLAKGYLNEIDLTHDNFISNPYSPDLYMYLTGDQGYWLDEGVIQFVGRKDNQVSLRGYRVEPREIEQALMTHPEIEHSIVTTYMTGEEKNLCAYFLSQVKQNTADLRTHLEQLLPNYMLPSNFMQLEELPLMANGKLDRKSLPDPGVSNGVEYIEPSTDMEKKIVAIWEDVLQREKIGVNDDFFELGGHSLKSTRLLSEYHKAFHVKLGLNDLFINTSLESHIRLIDSSTKVVYKEIEKVKEAESYKISNGQRRIWVLSQFENGSVTYNMPNTLILNGKYDIESFKRAVDSVINRHEILRTVFKEDEEGEIKQWVLDKEELEFMIDYKDFREEKDKGEKIKTYIKEDSCKQFNLEKGPLIRASLLQKSDDLCLFYYNMHHIVTDEWSMDVLTKDVFAYYEAYKSGREPELPELRTQYKDYSAWQLEQLNKVEFKTHRDYWLDNLSGELPMLELPSKKLNSKVQPHIGNSLGAYLTTETTNNLKSFCLEHEGSLFMGLLACWNILIYWYTSSKDIIVGTPIAGREHADLKDQIGFYVNTLAMRNQVDPKETFTMHFGKVKEVTLSAYTHQMYPFDRLVEDLDLVRDTSRSSVFNILFDFHNTGERNAKYEIKEAELNPISDFGEGYVKFDLEIHFHEAGNNILLWVNYNSGLYEREVIEGLIEHYKRLLSLLLEDLNQPIGKIDFLSIDEKVEQIESFNSTDRYYPLNETTIDLFRKQVEKTPESVALEFNDKKLRYKELNELSNQFAHCLKKDYGVKPNDLVGVLLDRSDWMVICILGILKVGAAYVPVDPDYPSSRRNYILTNSNVDLLITETNYLFDINDFDGSVFAIDAEFDNDRHSSEAINYIESQASLAYVLFTSGTTGVPKGVIVEHGSLMNYLCWGSSFYFNHSLRSLDFGLFTSLSFDLTMTSLFLPLINGGKLEIIDSIEDISVVLKNYFEGARSAIKLTPAHVDILRGLDLESTNLKLAIVGGDTLQTSHIETLKNLNPSIQVYNEYGPTESTVGCIVHRVDSAKENVLIGRPIANTKVYILNSEIKLVPKGVIGEVYIGGAGLARGYLNQPELTDEMFIDNPFVKGERLYKTGDLGKWLPSGEIEYFGRKDNQIKINGYRIELEGIENLMMQYHGILSAAVILKKEERNSYLAGFYTSESKIEPESISRFLSDRLPVYMIPQVFHQIKEIPFTTNHKVDKLVLAGLLIDTNKKQIITPRNDTERQIANIWELILGRENISIDDNFFESGGNSLSAIQCFLMLNETFDCKINVTQIYSHPTIRKLSVLLSSNHEILLEKEIRTIDL